MPKIKQRNGNFVYLASWIKRFKNYIKFANTRNKVQKNTEVKINTLTTAFYPQGTHCRRVQRKKVKVNNYKTVR